MHAPVPGFVRSVRAVTWGTLAALGAAAIVAPKVARPIVVALTVTIGIAHGATDAATLDRCGMRPRGGKTAISIAYGVTAIGVYLAALRFPILASRTLRVVSWAHFGSGDAAFARVCGSRGFEPLGALARGAAPLMIAGRDVRSAQAFACVAAYAARAIAADEVADAIDVLLPALVLYAAPSRLGFGAYFGAWHAPRHLALLLERDPRGGPYGERMRRFVREAAPNAAIASAFGAAAYLLRGTGARVEDLATALILGITVPHQIAVWAIEYAARSEGFAAS